MKHRQKGVAIVEFALVLPLLLLLTFFTTEFGRAIWEYNTLTKSVRDGARYLSTQQAESPAAIATARNLMVYGSYTNTGTPLAIGLDPVKCPSCVPDPTWNTIVSTPVNGSAPLIRIVTVRISGYQFNSMFITVFGLPFGAITFPDIKATMRSNLT